MLEGRTIGEYQVRTLLGRGGMGEVYEGLQPMIGKRVAIKVLMPNVAPNLNAAERFLSEARTVNAIGHRGIVDIFSFGTLPDGRHYFVMELLNGEPLNTYLTAQGPLAIAEAAQFLDELLDALDAVHRAGIVHRDLKPSNLFLAKQPNGTRYLKLLDFGIAKTDFEGRTETMPNLVLGTLQYMAPEQTRGNVSPAIDLWAAGSIGWRMLAGRVPYPQGPEAGDRHKRPPPLSEHRRDVPPAFETLLLELMAKDPLDRPPASAALERLKDIRENLTAVVKMPVERSTDPAVPAPAFTVRLDPAAVEEALLADTADQRPAPNTDRVPPVPDRATGQTDAIPAPASGLAWFALPAGVLLLAAVVYFATRAPAPPPKVVPVVEVPVPAEPRPVVAAPAPPEPRAPSREALQQRLQTLRAKSRNKAALILLKEEEAQLARATADGELRAIASYLDDWEQKYAPKK